MAMSTVSASVDENVKQAASMYIRRAGKNTNEVIKGLWEYIAQTGEVPDFSNAASGDDCSSHGHSEAFQNLMKLIESVPKGTPLASMSDDDLRKELRDRDI